MIEVFVVVVQSDVLVCYVDFFLIGINDLIQYVLVIDCQNLEFVVEVDSLYLVVLCVVCVMVEGVWLYGCWVGVCGGLVGDFFGVMLLVGLGVDELLMILNDILVVKVCLCGNVMIGLQVLVRIVLGCEIVEQVCVFDGVCV